MMKVIRFGVLLAVAGLVLCVGAAAPAPFRAGERVGFFGDSISEAGSQAFYLEYLSAIRHPGRGACVANMGRSGDTSWGGAARWARESAAQAVDRVFVMFGMNDIGSEDCAERYPKAMRDIVAKVRADALHAEIAAVRPVAWSLTLQAVQSGGGNGFLVGGGSWRWSMEVNSSTLHLHLKPPTLASTLHLHFEPPARMPPLHLQTWGDEDVRIF